MRVLVTGVKGQLGYDVMNELAKRGYEGVGVDVDEMDITDARKVDEVITKPRWTRSFTVRPTQPWMQRRITWSSAAE